MPTPAHEPGGLPEWLEELGVTHVIAAGLGEKAQKLLIHKGIEVVAGAPQGDPEELVKQYLRKPWHRRQCPSGLRLAVLHGLKRRRKRELG